MPTIIVRVTPTGETTIAVQGMTGPGCTDLTKALERALGQTVRDVHSRDFDAPAQEAQHEQRQT